MTIQQQQEDHAVYTAVEQSTVRNINQDDDLNYQDMLLQYCHWDT